MSGLPPGTPITYELETPEKMSGLPPGTPITYELEAPEKMNATGVLPVAFIFSVFLLHSAVAECKRLNRTPIL
jgi:hypothetical protein